MRQPHISIVTVVRNCRDHVADTLESILSQTYSAREHVVIDGGSTDGTLEVIARYTDHLAYMVSEPDRGIADAFNKGIRAARGDYLLFLNADDYLIDRFALEVVAEAAEREEGPALLHGDAMVVDRSSRRALYSIGGGFSRTRFLTGRMLPHPALFFHRRYFDKYGLYDETFKSAMDYELLLRGVFQERLVHVPRCISAMRHGGISTQDRQRAVDETLRALRKNGYLRNPLSEPLLRAYYSARRWARTGLTAFGLYRRVPRS
jgi:glycosyltransferase